MLTVSENTTLDLLTYLERLEAAVDPLNEAEVFALINLAVGLRSPGPEPRRQREAAPALRVIE